MTFLDIEQRRAIVDRRAISERLAGGGDITATLREALKTGRAEIARRLERHPGSGRSTAQAIAYLHDQIVRLAFDQVSGGASPGLALVGRKVPECLGTRRRRIPGRLFELPDGGVESHDVGMLAAGQVDRRLENGHAAWPSTTVVRLDTPSLSRASSCT